MPGFDAFWLFGMLGLLVERLGLLVGLPELLGFVGAGFGKSWRADWSSFWFVWVLDVGVLMCYWCCCSKASDFSFVGWLFLYLLFGLVCLVILVMRLLPSQLPFGFSFFPFALPGGSSVAIDVLFLSFSELFVQIPSPPFLSSALLADGSPLDGFVVLVV